MTPAIRIDPATGRKLFATRAAKATERIAGKGYSAVADEALKTLPPPPAGAKFDAEEQAKYREFKESRRGAADYMAMEGEFARYLDDVYSAPPVERAALTDDCEVLVIGAGFGALLLWYKLRAAGFTDVRFCEKGGAQLVPAGLAGGEMRGPGDLGVGGGELGHHVALAVIAVDAELRRLALQQAIRMRAAGRCGGGRHHLRPDVILPCIAHAGDPEAGVDGGAYDGSGHVRLLLLTGSWKVVSVGFASGRLCAAGGDPVPGRRPGCGTGQGPDRAPGRGQAQGTYGLRGHSLPPLSAGVTTCDT